MTDEAPESTADDALRKWRPTMEQSDRHTMDRLFPSLGVAVFRIAGARASLVGTPPPWYADVVGELTKDIRLEEAFAFLEVFLPEARELWSKGEPRHIHSGFWYEQTDRGVDVLFEATACSVDGKDLLLIERVHQEHDDRLALVQSVRSRLLDSDLEVQRNRRDAERQKNIRAELERRVAERTSQLNEANRRLRAEMEDRLAAEQRLIVLRDHLAHLARVATTGEIASGLSHELNQPLAAIVNYLNGCRHLLKRGPVDPAVLGSALERAAAEAERAGRIVNGLRRFLTKSPMDRKPVAINALVDEVAALLAHELHASGVAVERDFESDLTAAYADPIHIQQVLVNLIRNAVEAIRDAEIVDGVVRITSRNEPDGTVSVTVRDNGPGAGDVARLGEPFFTTKTDGMGMGLAICKTLLESHGGGLSHTPNEDRGLNARLWVPAFEENS